MLRKNCDQSTGFVISKNMADRFFRLVYMSSFFPAFFTKPLNPRTLQFTFKLGEANGLVCFDHSPWPQ